jgi:endoglucanase
MVVGFDLRNEPRPDETNGLMPTWGSGLESNDWKLAAQTAGDEILGINPNVLIIV